jgi:hypothetical protein
MVLVDLAIGSGWPIDHTPNPSVMKVHYVHVFAPPATGAAAASGTCGDNDLTNGKARGRNEQCTLR